MVKNNSLLTIDTLEKRFKNQNYLLQFYFIIISQWFYKYRGFSEPFFI